MITKKVNRYYCEYCKKSGCSAYWIKKHEAHCTLNPNRKCGMCEEAGNRPIEMNELLALLPEMKEFTYMDADQYSYSVSDELIIHEAIEALREKTENCPACILAAIRQKGIIVGVTPFDYKKEVEIFWGEVNSMKQEQDHYNNYC